MIFACGGGGGAGNKAFDFLVNRDLYFFFFY